jgi:hypothetical protein
MADRAAPDEAVLLSSRSCSGYCTLVEQDFTPVVPPVLVREHTMEQAGFFPTDRNQVYEVDGGELFLVGTAEVPLSALHRDEILPADTLPRRYLGMSSCFRREAGTYGKDRAASSACTSSTRSRCSPTRTPRRRGTSTRRCSRSRSSSSAVSVSRTA